jgi:hypothetical protein
MSAVPHLLKTIRKHGVHLTVKGERLVLSGSCPLPAVLIEQIKAQKQAIILALSPLPWWRDAEAIEARFDEISAYLEFDCAFDRESAEREALSGLAQELGHKGLSDQAVRTALDIFKKGKTR